MAASTYLVHPRYTKRGLEAATLNFHDFRDNPWKCVGREVDPSAETTTRPEGAPINVAEADELGVAYSVEVIDFVKKTYDGQVHFKEPGSGRTMQFPMSTFSYFADGDRVRVERDELGRVLRMDKLLSVPSRDGGQDSCVIYPYYWHQESTPLAGNQSLTVVYKEVTTHEEFDHLRYLEQFHYLKARPSWGRQMYIIARPIEGEILGTALPDLLGCVVLTSPSLFSKPRNSLLGWNSREDLGQNVDRVVRIARVIVHPEFRGLHLGGRLVYHAVEYCRERWNVKGKKAWFVETVAEMSRYHPFFEQGGLNYVGETKAQEKAYYFGDDPKSLGTYQGPGQVMASLKRFKQRTHSHRPFLIASLLPSEDPLSRAVSEAQIQSVRGREPRIMQDSLTTPITLQHVTLGYPGSSVWEEPQNLNKQWQASVLRMHSDLAAYLENLQGLVRYALTDRNLRVKDNEDAHDLSALQHRLDEMGTDVQAATDKLHDFGDGLSKLLSGLTSQVQICLARTAGLVDQAAATRRSLEAELRRLNSHGGTADDRSRRSLLNRLRLAVQRLETQLEIGAVSEQQEWVTQAFGVLPGQESTVVRDLNLEILPGQVVLIVGPSGSGKSTLLSMLNGDLEPLKGSLAPKNLPELTAALDLDFDPSRPLIDLVGESVEEAVYLLNHVGLAESHLYMKHRDQLSHGQRYRAAFAKMLGSRRPVWLADEFCAFLDPVTTLILCQGIRKLVQSNGITFIAAAAKEDHIRVALQPDLVVRINAGGRIRPSPKSAAWGWQPDVNGLLAALQGEPQLAPAPISRWLKRLELVRTDPRSLDRPCWTQAAMDLRLAGDNGIQAFANALAGYLWESDWLFHQLLNRARLHADGADLVRAIEQVGQIAGSFGRGQIAYRHRLIRSLLSLGVK